MLQILTHENGFERTLLRDMSERIIKAICIQRTDISQRRSLIYRWFSLKTYFVLFRR